MTSKTKKLIKTNCLYDTKYVTRRASWGGSRRVDSVWFYVRNDTVANSVASADLSVNRALKRVLFSLAKEFQ
jgi:hypothetical protein